MPAGAIGPVSSLSTFSLLGVAALPEGGTPAGNQNVLWLGATQPVGRLAGVRFDVMGSGLYRPSGAVGTRDAAEGTVAVRALTRIGRIRTWTAFSYGMSGSDANVSAVGDPAIPLNVLRDSPGDSTVMRRDDASTLARAEAGFLTSPGFVEFAFGVSVERSTRVTTERTTQLVEPLFEAVPLRTSRTREYRDVATGIASANFRTGSTDWLVSVTGPIATWENGDASSPRRARPPTVASIAVMHPLTAWLAAVGSASTNAYTVGTYALRDERADGIRRQFAPVVALGVRLSSFGARNSTGEPRGILAFETRTIGIIDSVTADIIADDTLLAEEQETGREVIRVLLIIDAPRAETVELMGDATAWNISQMSRLRDGKWKAELRVPPGMHRLVVRSDGGHWMAPPGLPLSVDDFGGRVGLLVVSLRND